MNTAVAVVNWSEEMKGAGYLIKSGLAPKDIRTAEAALFVILAGRDLGLSPVQSLRSIRPIQGKIECSADLQLGLFQRDGGRFRWLKIDEREASLELAAPWLNGVHVSTFTLDDAKRAGLLSNSTWTKYPKAMLRSRAITQGLKDIGFLVGSGMYAPGEIGGNVTVDVTTGEVLPGQQVSEPVLKQLDHHPLGGVVEALPDAERDALAERARRVTEHCQEGHLQEALALYEELDTDGRVALWAMLDKEHRKALKEEAKVKAAFNTSDAEAESESNEVASHIRKLIADGQIEAAKDLVRSLSPPMRLLLTREIDAVMEKSI